MTEGAKTMREGPAWVVEYHGHHDRHKLTFRGPNALSRALAYARERGRGASIRRLDETESPR